MFKDHDNNIYYFECDDESITMKKLCLKKMIKIKVKTYQIAGVQAVTYFHDAEHSCHDTEESWLKS
jgi:hypothetical protein